MRASGEMWMNRSVLVTGAGGFLGKWLCRALHARGARVVALDRPRSAKPAAFARLDLPRRVVMIKGDVTDQAAMTRVMAEKDVEVVFHAAACTQVSDASREPRRAYEVNIAGTWNILEAVRETRGKSAVVLVSSDAVYGDQQGSVCTEERPLLGTTPYAVSKICAELLLRAHAHTYGVRAAAARFTNLYGGGDSHADRIVPHTVTAALRGDSPVIRSDGSARRDYLYVDDAVEACLRLAEALVEGGVAGDSFNFSCERLVSVLELVDLILQVVGRTDLRPEVLHEARDDIAVKEVSAAKARARLGWRPQVPLEIGLERAVTWYRDDVPQAIKRGGAGRNA